MAALSPLPPAVGVEDFAFHSEEAETSPSHSRHQTNSSPPAPPLSDALSPDTRDYSFSSNIYDDYASSRSTSAHEVEYTTEEENLDHLHLPPVAQSTRSSVSSFPGSVLPDPRQQRLSTPTRSPHSYSHPDVLHHGRSGSLGYKIRSPAGRLRDGDRNILLEREYGSGFRNPSSVRAMQMRDEEPFDSDPETTPQHRRSGSRMSNFSQRSAHTSPTKCASQSNHCTPHKVQSPSKLKKEFPLVLLHCSLLPPTLALKTHISDEALLEELLPAEYLRRWKILQDKVGEDNEVRTRGVLIPHPREDYDVLEERLLESLELQRSRLQKGHYIGGDIDSGVGTESERDTESESEVEGQSTKVGPKPPKCPDCRKRVPQETEIDRKWEVKVYAANGLMRAGAWAAAWSEMEKVDVEVSVWMPEAVRREVGARLKELGVFEEDATHENHSFQETEEEHRQREIYGHGQETFDGLSEEPTNAAHENYVQRSRELHNDQSSLQPDLQSVAMNYVRVTMQDRRNIFMALLSILVLFLAISKPQSIKETGQAQSSIQVKQEAPVVSTSVSTLTSIEVVTATVLATPTSSIVAEASVISSTSLSLENMSSTNSTVGFEETALAGSPVLMKPVGDGEDNPVPSTLDLTTSKESTAVSEPEQPAVLEQVVEMFAGDDGIME
jgi:hypothetical protein